MKQASGLQENPESRRSRIWDFKHANLLGSGNNGNGPPEMNVAFIDKFIIAIM